MEKDLPEKLQYVLLKAGLDTPEQIICASDTVFFKSGASEEEITFLRNLAAKDICPQFMTVNEEFKTGLNKWKTLSFGCKALDACTGGGILTRGITEIYGEAGSGKTQILLQLCLIVQLPENCGGLRKGAVFINTEDVFPSKRLFQLSEVVKKNMNIETSFLENIYIQHIRDSSALINCVSLRLPRLMSSHDIGLIIIDSVAALFRIETNLVERANDMRTLSQHLLELGDKYACAIVCTNQVSYDVKSNLIIPSLGLAWSNLVRTRLMISLTERHVCYKNNINAGELFCTKVRKMIATHSPTVGRNTCEFLITLDGVVDVE